MAKIFGISKLPVSKIGLFEETVVPKPICQRVSFSNISDVAQFSVNSKKKAKSPLDMRNGFGKLMKSYSSKMQK